MDTMEADERWDAVQRRDTRLDGQFVYAVASTGIYCRPSCPSRPARRENVTFHADAAAARSAGFRACLRCTPDGPPPADRHTDAVAAACRSMDAEPPPGLDQLARAAGLSRYHFHRVFKAVTGVTPNAYAQARRAERVRTALADKARVTDAIYDAGYNASSRFYEQAERQLGMQPAAFRDGGRGAIVYFAVGQCSLGAILVASTRKGVCAVSLGDDPAVLVRELQDRFPRAELVGADQGFETVAAQVVGWIDTPGRFGLPLDVRGTAFQRKVWQALGSVQAGQTVSYTELAALIGRPSAVRAVAQACASNRLAVAIPCHRVVRADGGLSGYRWGVDRKRALLVRERHEAESPR